jgi:hypothetical protein
LPVNNFDDNPAAAIAPGTDRALTYTNGHRRDADRLVVAVLDFSGRGGAQALLETDYLGGGSMKHMRALSLIVVGLVSIGAQAALPAAARAQNPPKVQVPKPQVPEIMTMQGKFVRAAYNNEGYVILGYQLVNRSIGQEWMLIEVGMTVLDRTPNYTLKRAAISLETPDGKTLPLPSIEEFRSANTQALQAREKVQRDSINYFPPSASRASALTFFPDLTDRAMPRDEFELSNTRASLGRLYFRVPGGIKYGQHWLNVKFEKSLVRVPFRVLTDEEEDYLSKNFDDLSKQLENAFKKKD